MGLAASQARYLALTSRKSDLEYQSQTINTRRIQLSYKTAEIAEAYSEGMNNQRIKISHTEKDGSYSSTVWEELTFSNLLNNKSGASYMLIGVNGAALEPAPYTVETTVDGKKYVPSADTNIAAIESANITYNDYASGAYIASDVSTTAWSSSSTTETEPTDTWKYQKKDDGKYYLINTWKLNPDLTTADYNKIKEFDTTNDTTYASRFTEKDNVSRNYKVNSQYENQGGLDIQTLLTSNSAQIVTKEFFDYLVNNWGYSYANGITQEQFKQAQDNWTNQVHGTEQINSTGKKSVVEWQADDSAFQQRTYTEDDAYVLAKYEADTAKIQAQDKILETQEKNIETQHKAIETELDGLKKVIENNIDKSFKMFS